MRWDLVFRVAFEALVVFGRTFVDAWRHVASIEARHAPLGLTPNKKMTIEEAKQILGLEKIPTGQLTKSKIDERWKKLVESNNEEGSLFIRLKVNNAKKELDKHFKN
eukprot:TRINITY_DN8809_c0_g1_i1.p1 TRINITY_DN8809_c0_g1~~TRINITY_DN8809_c0_g1_i1.p1  ORF type:complete len:107 (-),score=24.78 TRINITY_DN8809_c0_g1_i1:259-579(-)